MLQKIPILVAGDWVETPDILEVKCPYDDQLVGTTFKANAELLEKAIKSGLEAQKAMANLPLCQRFEILRQTSEAIKKDRESLGLLLALESGKPLKYALAEVDRAAQTFLIAAEESKRPPNEIMRLDNSSLSLGKKAYVEYFPVGLVAAISPFNFPLNLVAHKLAPAIAAGCPLILKPASATPLSALRLAEILHKTSLPKGALSVMPMDRVSGNQLVTDDRFKLLTFTGSPSVGWAMKTQCGKKKVVLELGGNAGAIITPNADLSYVIPRCIFGGFAVNGQSCVHAQRILVHHSLLNNFLDQYKAAAESLKIGHPKNPDTDISGLIDENNAIRVESWISEAVAGGAKLITGGTRNGSVVTPTILTNTNKSMKVVCEEVFGPVVIVEGYENFEEAIATINDTNFGLQAGVFTTDWNEINYAFKHLEVGGVIINDIPSFRADAMPYGGIKDSGLGREGPKYAMLDMLEPRLLIIPS